MMIDDLTNWKIIEEYMSREAHPSKELLPGICWGNGSKLFSPAYWKVQYHLHSKKDDFLINYKLGRSIKEEVVACLLGGFGLKSELGIGAFYRLRDAGLINRGTNYETINECLKTPFIMNGREVSYRFPNQKAKYISEFLKREDIDQAPVQDDLEFRNWLLTIKGIGLKTASWITRNCLNSENVAIIDIHIYRAGLLAGLFNKTHDIAKDYLKLEEKFILFCKAIDVKPSKMDALIWLQMKATNIIALKSINKLKS